MHNPFSAELPFFHPGSILLLDDEEEFLQSLRSLLGLDHAVLGYSSADQALSHIRRSQTIAAEAFDLIGQSGAMADGNGTGPGDRLVLFKSETLHQTGFSPARYNLTPIVIVDEVMPEMRGLEFCHLLRDTGIKTILLTGAMTDPSQTIEAFNSGKIDRFISKGDPNILSLVEKAIHDLQREYFVEKLAPLSAAVRATATHMMTDDQLQTLFDHIHTEFPFSEYFYHGRSGGYLLRTKSGETRMCLFSTLEELGETADFLEEHQAADEQTLWEIAKGHYVLWELFDDFDPPGYWQSRLPSLVFPATLHGNIAWSLVPLQKFPYQNLPLSISWDSYRKQLMSYPLNWIEAA